MSRQLRRKPVHRALPLQYPSNERIVDKEKPKTSGSKGKFNKKKIT